MRDTFLVASAVCLAIPVSAWLAPERETERLLQSEIIRSRLRPREGVAAAALVGSPRGLLPEAPTDPDVRNSRIRLFGSRLRYVTGEERMRGCGSGYRSSSRFIPSHDVDARCERRLNHIRHTPMTRNQKLQSAW
jgi:hypothetical protein